MRTQTVLLTAVTAALLIGLFGCQSPPDGTVIRVGYLQNDLHHLPLFVALEKGFFEQAGLKVEIAGVFRAGPEQMSAFGAGELDVGYVGQVPATAAALNGVADVRFIAQVNRNGSAIVVKKNAPLRTLQDLRGKLVAIPGHATMQDFLLRSALKRDGVPVDAVQLIVLKPPEMLQSLTRGNIDAFIAWEPYPAQADMSGAGRTLSASAQIMPGHPCCVIAASTVFVRKHPQHVAALQTVHRRSCAFITDSAAEAIAIGTRYTGLSEPVVKMAVAGITYTEQLDRAQAEQLGSFLKDLHYVKPSARLTAGELVIETVP